MAALLGEIDESPEMRQQLNELMGELAAGAERAIEEEGGPKREGGGDQSSAKEAPGKPSPPSSAGATAESAGGSSDPAFTDTIRRTLERMAESGQQASAAAQAGAGGGAGSEDDMLAAILKDMAAGAGEDSEEEFSKMLLGMMEQLTNKGILYEPMKELDTKFPEWMEENEGKVAEEDMKRYKEQQGLVKEIVGRFEREGYSDEDPGDREFIVERMQKVSPAVSVVDRRGIGANECVDASGGKPSLGSCRGHEGSARGVRGIRSGLSAAMMCFISCTLAFMYHDALR